MKQSVYLPSSTLKWVSLTALILTWVTPAICYDQLPPEVPRHFDGSGVPDAYAHKAFIWFIPMLSLLFFYALGRIMRIPYRPNSFWNNSPTEKHHLLGMEMIDGLRVMITWSFAYTVLQIIWTGLGYSSGLGKLFLPVFLLGIFGTIGYYIWRMAILPKLPR